MGYLPIISGKKEVSRERLSTGRHTAILFDDITSPKRIVYRFLLAVYEDDNANEPSLLVAAETSVAALQEFFLGQGHEEFDAIQDSLSMGHTNEWDKLPDDYTYFFCLWQDGGRMNLGPSNGLGNIETFKRKALSLAEDIVSGRHPGIASLQE